jgi:glycosyltransferase involved in cell wall biosynthesis
MDRDLGDKEPYTSIDHGKWQKVGKGRVRYVSPEEVNILSWKQLVSDHNYDLIYLNGFFHSFTIKTLIIHRLKMIDRRPLLLAPRGEFSPGALGIKRQKKQAYALFVKLSGLCADISWQASSEKEYNHILAFNSRIGIRPDKVFIAPNMPPKSSREIIDTAPIHLRYKETGSVKIVFLSRVARMKNLSGALKILSEVRGQIQFDIYGPLEDTIYWRECEGLIAQLPANIQVRYLGVVLPEHVYSTFSQYHMFLFPTLGENFGHAILESLRAGCPVLISDRTPWQHLEEHGAGWDISLDHTEEFVTTIEQVVAMDARSFQYYEDHSRMFGEAFVANPEVRELNRQMLLQAMENIQ